jgi:hypothetical protein
MTGWNPQLTRLRQQLARIALTPGADLAERSAAALEALGRVLPFDAAWLAVRNPEARRHTPLATAGAAEPLRSYFETPVADAEVDALGLSLPGLPGHRLLAPGSRILVAAAGARPHRHLRHLPRAHDGHLRR